MKRRSPDAESEMPATPSLAPSPYTAGDPGAVSPMRFVISAETRTKLREALVQSLNDEVECGGAFVAVPLPCGAVSLELRDDPTVGTRSRLKIVRDAPYTFHTHCIVFAADTPSNYANLIGSEDLIGIVEDDARNRGSPCANMAGVSVFDVLCCPMGFFVYGAGPRALAQWRKLAPSPEALRRAERSGVAQANFGFEQWLGASSWDRAGVGEFSRLKASFQFIGYECWWPPSRAHPPLPADQRSWSGREEQLGWFASSRFLASDVAASERLLPHYLSCLEDLGFHALFFNWGPLSSPIGFSWPPAPAPRPDPATFPSSPAHAPSSVNLFLIFRSKDQDVLPTACPTASSIRFFVGQQS